MTPAEALDAMRAFSIHVMAPNKGRPGNQPPDTFWYARSEHMPGEIWGFGATPLDAVDDAMTRYRKHLNPEPSKPGAALAAILDDEDAFK